MYKVTIASFKGGVGKTTTAIHLAAYLQDYGPTLLVDRDPTRGAIQWSQEGLLPFKVVSERDAPGDLADYANVVIDTPARPSDTALYDLVMSSDILIIPTTPSALAIGALVQMIDMLTDVGTARMRVLMTMTPTHRSAVTSEAREALEASGLTLFRTNIRRYVAYEYAVLQGCTVRDLEYCNADKAWEDYAAVGEELRG